MMTRTTITLFVLLLCPAVAWSQSTDKSTEKSGSEKKAGATQKPKAEQKAGSDKKAEGSEKKAEMAKQQKFSVAEGVLNFAAPAAWKKVTPKFDFYHAEFQIPTAEGDSDKGRITFSQVNGSVDANLDRWVAQFKSEDGKDNNKQESKTIAGKKVTMVYINGTFSRPFGPQTGGKKNYKLIGAAIEMETGGNVYIKAYGPAKTMDANKKLIEKLISGMTVTAD